MRFLSRPPERRSAPESEVQNLVRDIRGLKKKSLPGTSRSDACEASLYSGVDAVLLVKRDQNVAVARSRSWAVTECQLIAAVRKPDVVDNRIEFTRGIDLRISSSTSAKYLLGLLNAGADGRSHVQPHLAGVDIREEVPPMSGSSANDPTRRSQKAPRTDGPVVEAPLDSRPFVIAPQPLESTVERASGSAR